VKVKQGERGGNSFLAFPEVKDKVTAVVVIHEIFGLTDWMRGVADQLAVAGYIANTARRRKIQERPNGVPFRLRRDALV
jgi:dienelactone hydrolase